VSFADEDYWKAIILYGLNQSTYKIALGKTLVTFSKVNKDKVTWEELSKEFLTQYRDRLKNKMPQQLTPGRRTVMETISLKLDTNAISFNDAVKEVGENAFGDVLPRFHNLLNIPDTKDLFFEFNDKESLTIKDSAFRIFENSIDEIEDELDSRWSLIEAACSIKVDNYELGNEILKTYIEKGEERKNITGNIPFLQGYQSNTCFYCAEHLPRDDIHVDHVIPWSVIHHNEIWNLVLSHSFCNESKSDNLVGSHFINKLILRNENIMGSSFPWKSKLIDQIGDTPKKRKQCVLKQYEDAKKILGNRFWGGVESYNPTVDPFYKKLITKMNNS
jgi:hypothetical protein